jgi:mono/diheme cytochrome c family protein
MKKVLIIIQTVFATIAVLAIAGAIGAAGFVYAGVYDVAATEQHTGLTYHLLHYAMERSVKLRAHSVKAPPLDAQARLDNGVLLYRQHCSQCHGAPGVAPEPFALGMRPAPVNLVEPGRDWPSKEIYWVIKHGVKMAGMPGWQYRFSEEELWDLVAFVKYMPALSPQQYQDWKPARPGPRKAASPASLADEDKAIGSPRAGLHAIYQYMCVTCHTIPGAVGGDTNVGPPLGGIATRSYIGGVLRNTPDNMVRWLQDPKAIDPLSGMPNLGVREQDARDISAYLYTLKDAK